VYVCVCVCIYVCMYVCVCVCMYVCVMYVCMHACMYVCMCVCVYACMYVCIVNVCMYVFHVLNLQLFISVFNTMYSVKFTFPSWTKVVKRLTKWPVFCICFCSLFQILNESFCTKFSQYLHRSFQILELIVLVFTRVTSPPNSPSCVHLKRSDVLIWGT